MIFIKDFIYDRSKVSKVSWNKSRCVKLLWRKLFLKKKKNDEIYFILELKDSIFLKMSVLPKVTHRYNKIFIKSPTDKGNLVLYLGAGYTRMFSL